MKEKNECGCGHGECPQCGSRHEQRAATGRNEDAIHDDIDYGDDIDYEDDIDYGAAGGGDAVGGDGFAFAAYGIL